eukprot:10817222-Alexandrium_andersonii.AAC.1
MVAYGWRLWLHLGRCVGVTPLTYHPIDQRLLPSYSSAPGRSWFDITLTCLRTASKLDTHRTEQ